MALRLGLALRLAVLGGGALAVLAGAPEIAHAQAGKKAPPGKDPKLAEAKRLFDEGSEAYGNGRYEDAVKAWEKSYELSGKPLIFESIASAYERLGNKKKAREYLAKWRDEAPKAERDQLDARLKNLDARIAAEDAAEAARKAEEDKRKAEKDAADQKAKDAEKAKGESRGGNLKIALAVGGVGVLAAGVGIALDAVAAGQRPDAKTVCGTASGKTLCKESAKGSIESSSTLAVVGDVSWIAGAALVATGVTLFFVLPSPAGPAKSGASEPPKQARPPERWISVGPWVGGERGGAVVRGSF